MAETWFTWVMEPTTTEGTEMDTTQQINDEEFFEKIRQMGGLRGLATGLTEEEQREADADR